MFYFDLFNMFLSFFVIALKLYFVVFRSGKKLKRRHEDSEAAERKNSKEKKRKTKVQKKSDFVGMTLAEDEELALHILGNRW